MTDQVWVTIGVCGSSVYHRDESCQSRAGSRRVSTRLFEAQRAGLAPCKHCPEPGDLHRIVRRQQERQRASLVTDGPHD